MKSCSRCGVLRELSEFYARTTSKDGRAGVCKPCVKVSSHEWYIANREKAAAYHQERYRRPEVAARRREVQRRGSLRRKYGITVDQFDAILDAQGGVCAVCKADAPMGHNWHVDHDHSDGVVRGVLCSNCNTMIGLSGDRPNVLLAAADYLVRTSSRLGQSQTVLIPSTVGGS